MLRYKLVALSLLLGALVVVSITARLWTASHAEVAVAGHPTDLPYVPAPGAPTPGPTPTLVAAPLESQPLFSEEYAAEELKTVANAYGSLSGADVATVQAKAGDYEGAFPFLAPDYPLWVATGTGTFHPRTAPPGTPYIEYARITIYVDAVTGRVPRVQLTDQQAGPE
jgi:hypothetical protein